MSPKIKRHGAWRAGYTLVEVLIAFGVGGIVFVTLYTGLARGFSTVESAHHRLRATQILTEKLEVIRLYNWTQINTPGFIPSKFTDYYFATTNSSLKNRGTPYTGTCRVSSSGIQPPYSNSLRRVVVQVQWVSGGVTNQQKMESFVSQYGIHDYVY